MIIFIWSTDWKEGWRYKVCWVLEAFLQPIEKGLSVQQLIAAKRVARCTLGSGQRSVGGSRLIIKHFQMNRGKFFLLQYLFCWNVSKSSNGSHRWHLFRDISRDIFGPGHSFCTCETFIDVDVQNDSRMYTILITLHNIFTYKWTQYFWDTYRYIYKTNTSVGRQSSIYRKKEKRNILF